MTVKNLSNKTTFIIVDKVLERNVDLKAWFKDVLSKMRSIVKIHSSTLAWRIPWMEEPGRLQSMGSLRVGHN